MMIAYAILSTEWEEGVMMREVAVRKQRKDKGTYDSSKL
jgi:hypothetical protein